MPPSPHLDGELHLTTPGSALFTWDGRNYPARLELGDDLREKLTALESTPGIYGRELFDAVFPRESKLREGLRQAIVVAEREERRLHFRLRLAPDLPAWLRGLDWELLVDTDRRLPLACSTDTPFSRYLDLPRAARAPIAGRPRLLCVVSAPSDVGRLRMAEIRREKVVARLEAAFADLAGSVEVEILAGPATLSNLRTRLKRGGVHLLHFFGHGQSRGGASALVLENEQGAARRATEEELSDLFEDNRELRLATLVACHGSAPSSEDPFSGLAGRLVECGLPAVIAMCREVSFDTAHLFSEHFYRELARTGQVDAAVNEARHQLHLHDRRGIDWSSPVLYSRLADGRLWLPAPPAAEPAEPPALSAEAAAARRRPFDLSLRHLWHPLPWLPALVWLLLLALHLQPAAKAEVRLALRVSELAFRLARNSNLIESFQLTELGAARLAALRLPAPPPGTPPWAPPGPGGLHGVLLAARHAGSAAAQVTLNPVPLPAGTRIALAHQGERSYQLTLDGARQNLAVTVQGEIVLRRQGAAPVELRLNRPETLELAPHDGSAVLDLTFARFAPDALARAIAVDRLGLTTLEEHHTPTTTAVEERSTLLAGELRVPASGRRLRLGADDLLRFTAVAGALTGLRLGSDGIRFELRGRVSGLTHAPAGGPPRELMPSLLQTLLPGKAGTAALFAAALLALLFPLLALCGIGPFRKGDSMSRLALSKPVASLFLPFVLLLAGGSPLAAQEEKTVFKLGLILNDSAATQGNKKALYREVLNEATDAFVQSRRFDIVERSQLNAIFTEKDLQGFIGGKTNQKLTDVKGLDFIGIVDFTTGTRKVKDKVLALFEIKVRMVDVKTAGVFASLTSDHPELIVPPSNPSEAGRHLLKTVREAFPPRGYVLKITGKEVIVDLGSEAGIKDGDVLEIVQEGEQIIHPVKNIALPGPLEVLGELKVVAISPAMSTCKLKAAKGAKDEVTPGDFVQLKGSRSVLRKWLEKGRSAIDIITD